MEVAFQIPSLVASGASRRERRVRESAGLREPRTEEGPDAGLTTTESQEPGTDTGGLSECCRRLQQAEACWGSHWGAGVGTGVVRTSRKT